MTLASFRRVRIRALVLGARLRACMCTHPSDTPFLTLSVVVPLLSMSKSVLLCISTLLDGGNHYSKMFNLSDSLGRPLFANIQVRASATRLASVRSSYTPPLTGRSAWFALLV